MDMVGASARCQECLPPWHYDKDGVLLSADGLCGPGSFRHGLQTQSVPLWSQACSRAWYSRFATFLLSQGFVEAKADTSLFVFRRGMDTAYLLYVDDIVLTASSPNLLRRVISSLQQEFPMKDLSELHHFLGITVERRPQGLFLH
jgi:hypothetical protein